AALGQDRGVDSGFSCGRKLVERQRLDLELSDRAIQIPVFPVLAVGRGPLMQLRRREATADRGDRNTQGFGHIGNRAAGPESLAAFLDLELGDGDAPHGMLAFARSSSGPIPSMNVLSAPNPVGNRGSIRSRI